VRLCAGVRPVPQGRSQEARTDGRTFDATSLVELGSFFEKHADAIEANRVATLDFVTGEPTDHTYTRAKVLDMIFFMEGYGSGQVVPPP
jgi:hypothetical protein